ncbi:NADH-quinone oxidoreductase subunit L [Salinisphaera orenii]|uniref:NADH-quinone oxidoreductase subunit L n=1 Tax=Salinisphaera orenii TaxID=856731 RepID=UPI000DBE850D
MSAVFLTIVFPLLGALILSLRPGMPDRSAKLIGAGSVGLSALTMICLMIAWFSAGGGAYVQMLWHWVEVGDFSMPMALRLDGLSLTMIGVVTGVGFLIHLFATWYMTHDLEGAPGMARFFAYMNLFIGAMLILVLADNLLVLYLGWEGVGLCSYLLVGYYYQTEANAWAAFKAFVMTRIGDVSLSLGLFILYVNFGTLNIDTLLQQAPEAWVHGGPIATLTALLILGGAVGKSAQLPLQTWLVDAMAGPTPVSALIHAATMVTAGVYLIARLHGLFIIAPAALEIVGIVGGITLLLAGFAALAQTDIKRVIAYSTMSQIGYMFLALGVGAWHAAIFHLMIHAFFKSLLFLAAGSVIIACHHEQNIFKMGGLRKQLPLDYALFWVGGGALSALPVITAGFWSKDQILSLAAVNGHVVLWLMALLGAFITALYTFRLIFIVFHGEANTHAEPGRGWAHHTPLITLAVLSTFVGALIGQPLDGVLPAASEAESLGMEILLEVISSLVALGGLAVTAALFLGARGVLTKTVASDSGSRLHNFLYGGLGFDTLYDRLFVRPYRVAARLHRLDWIEGIAKIVPSSALLLNNGLTSIQSGQLRWYALTIFGAASIFLIVLVLG